MIMPVGAADLSPDVPPCDPAAKPIADPAADPASGPLPEAVARWLEVAWPDGPGGHETVALIGRARIRRDGTGPRVPATFRMTHLLGRHHVAEIRVGIGPVTLARAFDAYVDGHGVAKVGTAIDCGPAYDQAAFVFLWAEAFAFPASWPHLPGLRWEPVNHHAAVLRLPFGDAAERALVRFDPETAMPSAFEASRHKGDGPRVPWHVGFDEWGVSNGLAIPRRGWVRWSDEPGPWFAFTVDEALPDAPVDDLLRRARDVLADATGTARG